jgi:hypothetical protein
MENQVPLDKKKRCPKGQIRNKDGICVPKVEAIKEPKPAKAPAKAKEPKPEKSDNKGKSKKTPPKKRSPKAKTIKNLTKILAQRRKCIQQFRDKL